jgi:hypothetical protein
MEKELRVTEGLGFINWSFKCSLDDEVRVLLGLCCPNPAHWAVANCI